MSEQTQRQLGGATTANGVSRSRKRRRRKKSPTGDMTIIEHIQELRRRLIVALAAMAVGTIIGYIWYDLAIGPIRLWNDFALGRIPSLGEILIQPYCALPDDKRFGDNCTLLATKPFDMFILRLKVGALAGVVMSSPVWLAQIWAYITPGLRKNEKRWAIGVGSTAGLLFVGGAVLAYFVLYFGLEFLMTIGDSTQTSALTGADYFSFVLALLILFGVSFEVPLMTVLLNTAGLISYEQLKEKRRYIIVFLFVFAAFMTPGQDPVSMVILAVVLVLLMEIATQICRINDKRRAKRQEEWMRVGDDATSPIDAAAPLASDDGAVTSTVGLAASPIAAPSPVNDGADYANIDYDSVEVTPAPRSSSGARPRSQAQQQAPNPSTNQQQHPRGRDYGDGGYFDDVL